MIVRGKGTKEKLKRGFEGESGPRKKIKSMNCSEKSFNPKFRFDRCLKKERYIESLQTKCY